MMINSHNHQNNHATEKMQRCHDYIHALEEERRKIQVFQRELPLCLELVTQAIETCKNQLSGTTTEYNLRGQSECNSEQTSSEGPVLEEFIPLKRATSSSSDEDDDNEHHSHKRKNDSDNSIKDNKNTNDKVSKKSDWLRSVQLWNQTPDPPKQELAAAKKVSVMEVKRDGSGGAFHPFKREKTSAEAPTATAMSKSAGQVVAETSSTADTGGSSGGNKKEDKENQAQRKTRRCWSPELHRRFLQALQQLGGSHVATPKQIRELMKVDGLTNDEVKSHLQKYRLHTRRPSPSIHNNNNNPQAPQFVVVGGIWVPPPEYAAVAATGSGEAPGCAAASTAIYAPIASLPQPQQSPPMSLKQRQQQQHRQPHSDERGSHSEEGVSHSPSTSSSTHTTTASHAY